MPRLFHMCFEHATAPCLEATARTHRSRSQSPGLPFLELDRSLFRAVLTQLFEPTASPQARKIYVVIDNYRIHFAKPVLAFLQAHQDRIELVCLPTYSPKLNPVERFWKHLRRRVTHNTFFQTIERLLEAITGFFQEMAVLPDTVRSIAGLAA